MKEPGRSTKSIDKLLNAVFRLRSVMETNREHEKNMKGRFSGAATVVGGLHSGTGPGGSPGPVWVLPSERGGRGDVGR